MSNRFMEFFLQQHPIMTQICYNDLYLFRRPPSSSSPIPTLSKELCPMSDVILQQILAELQGVKFEISGMKSEITGIKSEISGLKADVKNLQTEFATFKSEITAELVIIKDEIVNIKADIVTIKDDIVTVKADIESIKEDTKLIPLIQPAVSEVNAEVVAGRDSLERIDRSLRGHDATLDILARRSIDQEAELKRLAASA